VDWSTVDTGLPGPTYEEQIVPGRRFFRVEEE
jgi:hypothetical protein